jgi:chemotaxis protein histidine kinase CheA/ActR/RegA family two-component response regulator
MLPEQQQRILGYFIEEAKDHLNTIEQGLLNLQETLNDQEMINEVFRAAHSIKGGAAMLSLSSIQRTAHRLEDCFKVLKENHITVDQKLESLFLGVSDTLKALLEHLSGPFGLSDEQANTLMSEAEPVFGWLNEHLELLLGEQKGTAIKVSTEVNQIPVASGISSISNVSAANTVNIPGADSWQQFQASVLQKLRDMLQLFKQNANSESRKGLEACCQYLVVVGEELNLTNWCHLCRSAASAITNPDNSYLTLAKVVITEIKQAQELALKGRDAEITVSPQLEALIAVPDIELLELSSDFFDNAIDEAIAPVSSQTLPFNDLNQVPESVTDDVLAPDIEASQEVDFNLLFDISEGFDISEVDITELGVESSDHDDTIESLFELSDSLDLEVSDHNNPLEDNSLDEVDNISSLFGVSEAIDNAALDLNGVANNGDNLLFDMDNSIAEINDEISHQDINSSYAEALNSIDTVSDPNGPEVGIAELTELDELFKDDASELDDTWHGEQINSIETASVDETEESNTDIDVSNSELDDLLVIDGTNFYERLDRSPGELTVVQLFGNALDDVEEATVNDAVSVFDFESVDLIDTDNDNLFAPEEKIEVEEVDNFDLFASEEKVEVEDVEEVDNFDLFAPEEKIEAEEVDNFDLFASEEKVEVEDVDNFDLFKEDVEVENIDLFASEDKVENNLASLESSENVNSQLEVGGIDDVFGTPVPASPEFSSSDAEELADFWTPTEMSNSETLNNDVGLILEESLFAATSNSNDIFESYIEISSPEEDLGFEYNVFEELTPSQIAAVSERNINDSHEALQQPEALLIEPEFTHSLPDNVGANSFDDIGIESSDAAPFLEDIDEDVLDFNTPIANLEASKETTVQSFDVGLNSLLDDTMFVELDDEPVNNDADEDEDVDKASITASEQDVFDPDLALEQKLLNNPVSDDMDFIDDSEFAALEAILMSDDIEVPNNNDVDSVVNSPVLGASKADNIVEIDDFSDLEKMLASSDSIGGTSNNGNAAKAQRPVPRRSNNARFEQLMKVSVKHLDDMSNLVGELVVNRNTLEQDQERLRQSLDNLLIQIHHLSDVGARMQELYERSLLEASLLATRKHGNGFGYNSTTVNNKDTERGFSELEMDRFTPFHTLSQEMIELIVRVRESASDIDFVTEETERVARQFRQVTTQLQEGLTRARMVPFSQVTDRVRRGVRDNAIKCGKQVELVIEGQDTLIDKMILEHLTDPLIHMLNNAIAHGIETPSQRTLSGKQPVGTITVRAFHQGNQTVISVSDDGAGINTDYVKQKAIKVGLITPEQASTISRIEVYELLFQPNFSTKDQADDLAGRGVGMDVVRTSISEIRGTITTDSSLGKGTSFTIRLPLTLSICKALCCVWDKARIAFPMDGVEDTLDISVKSIQKNSDGEQYILWRDTKLPFKPLKELLTLNRQISRGSVYGGTRDDDMVSVVVIRSASILIGLQVDQVLSEQEIVIKQFEGPAPKPIGVAGATVLGDGRIMPIADVLEIIDIFQGRTSKQSAVPFFEASGNSTESTGAKIDPTVLIVDDSITVRELLSLSFNKAGYRVEQARDGQEAWEKLRSGLPCDIVFCDIEMPRCDGLELLSRISKEPSLSQLPIAMLTSRGADKHKQMAINLGASGYFTKPYLEEALLEAAGRMLKGEKLVVPSNG